MMIVRALIIGLELDILTPSSHLDDLQLDKKYDFVAIVPLQAENSLAKLHQFKKIIVGGAKVSDELANKLLLIPSDIYETYGMTETITHIAAKKIGEDYFNVLSHASVSSDTRNCLIIDAPSISTEKIITNDIVEIQNSKQFKWLGRYDNVINSGGIKLFPEQIEAKLTSKLTNRFFIEPFGASLEYLSLIILLCCKNISDDVIGSLYFSILDFNSSTSIAALFSNSSALVLSTTACSFA
jgi:O-succinylbenzoic acid--CoA ligase